MPEKSLIPNVEKFTPKYPRPVRRVDAWQTDVIIERVVGIVPPGNWYKIAKRTVLQTRRYRNISGASRVRLHKAVSNLVNASQATISLYDGGYEVEL